MHSLGLRALFTALLAAGCGSGSDQPPTVPRPGELRHDAETQELRPLSDADRAVIAALIEQRLQQHAHSDAPGAGGRSPVVVLSDATLRSCPPDYDQRARECIPPSAFQWLDRHPEWGSNLTGVFNSQNADARTITSSPSEKAALASIQDLRVRTPRGEFSKWQLLQHYPRGSDFFQISAPVYPNPSEALVFYHSVDTGGGFCFLVRSGDRWAVKGCDGWTE